MKDKLSLSIYSAGEREVPFLCTISDEVWIVWGCGREGLCISGKRKGKVSDLLPFDLLPLYDGEITLSNSKQEKK